MARLAITAGAVIAGAAVTALTGNPLLGAVTSTGIQGIGAATLYAIGYGQTSGPRLLDRQVMSSSNGAPILWGYGTQRVSGEVLWSSGLLILRKGDSDFTSYKDAENNSIPTNQTYITNLAVAFGEGPATITRLWFDSKLVFDLRGSSFRGPWQANVDYKVDDVVLDWSMSSNPTPSTDSQPLVYFICVQNLPAIVNTDYPHATAVYWEQISAYYNTSTGQITYRYGFINDPAYQGQYDIALTDSGLNLMDVDPFDYISPKFYRGDEAQMPDPLLESQLGIGKTSAMRGLNYMVLENFVVWDFNNRIPNIRAEVAWNPQSVYPVSNSPAPDFAYCELDQPRQIVHLLNTGGDKMANVPMATGVVSAEIDLPATVLNKAYGVDADGFVWMASDTGSGFCNLYQLDPTTYQPVQTIPLAAGVFPEQINCGIASGETDPKASVATTNAARVIVDGTRKIAHILNSARTALQRVDIVAATASAPVTIQTVLNGAYAVDPAGYVWTSELLGGGACNLYKRDPTTYAIVQTIALPSTIAPEHINCGTVFNVDFVAVGSRIGGTGQFHTEVYGASAGTHVGGASFGNPGSITYGEWCMFPVFGDDGRLWFVTPHISDNQWDVWSVNFLYHMNVVQHTVTQGQEGEGLCCVYYPIGKQLFIPTANGYVGTWDIASGSYSLIYPPPPAAPGSNGKLWYYQNFAAAYSAVTNIGGRINRQVWRLPISPSIIVAYAVPSFLYLTEYQINLLWGMPSLNFYIEGAQQYCYVPSIDGFVVAAGTRVIVGFFDVKKTLSCVALGCRLSSGTGQFHVEVYQTNGQRVGGVSFGTPGSITYGEWFMYPVFDGSGHLWFITPRQSTPEAFDIWSVNVISNLSLQQWTIHNGVEGESLCCAWYGGENTLIMPTANGLFAKWDIASSTYSMLVTGTISTSNLMWDNSDFAAAYSGVHAMGGNRLWTGYFYIPYDNSKHIIAAWSVFSGNPIVATTVAPSTQTGYTGGVLYDLEQWMGNNWAGLLYYVYGNQMWLHDGTPQSFVIVSNGQVTIAQAGRLGTAPALLSEVVADLCAKAEIPSANIDVTQLAGLSIIGYTIARPSSGKQILGPLAQGESFDCVESDKMLKFLPRPQPVVMTIPADDLGLDKDKGAIEESIGQEGDFPQALEVSYQDPALNYQVGHQYHWRNTRVTGARDRQTVELPYAITAFQARQTGIKLMKQLWHARFAYGFNLFRASYLQLDPADPVTFTDPTTSNVYTARLVSVSSGQDRSMKCALIQEATSAYLTSGASGGGPGLSTSGPNSTGSIGQGMVTTGNGTLDVPPPPPPTITGTNDQTPIPAQGSDITLPAGEDITALSAISVHSDGNAYLADASTLSDAGAVIGIAIADAASGADVTVRTEGELDSLGIWSFTPGAQVFVGLAGLVTATPTTGTAFNQCLGTASASGIVIVELKTPIIL